MPRKRDRAAELESSFHSTALIGLLPAPLAGAMVYSDPLYAAAILAVAFLLIFRLEKLPAWIPFLKLALTIGAVLLLVNLLFSRQGATVLFALGPYPIIGKFTLSIETVIFSATTLLRLLAVFSLFFLYGELIGSDRSLRFFSRWSLAALRCSPVSGRKKSQRQEE